MTILNSLNTINRRLRSFHGQFKDVERERVNLDSVYASRIGDAKSHNQSKREQIESLKADVLKYYRIAKDNTTKDLMTSGISGQKPNIAKLNDMIEQIDDSNLNDPVAAQIVDLASKYIAYLDRELKSLDQAEQSQIQKILSQKDLDLGKIESSKRQVLSECKTYLMGKDVRDLASLFDRIKQSYEIDSRFFSEWGKPTKKKKMMLIGYGEFPIDIPKMFCSDLKASLGGYFDEKDKGVCYPCGFTTTSSENIYVEYTELNVTQTKLGLQALALNFMRYFRPTEYRISIFDQIYLNADLLGPLSQLAGIKNGLIDDVPTDSKSMKKSMERLCSYYRKVEAKIGTDSVYAYNARVEQGRRIPYRTIIINKLQGSHSGGGNDDLSFVLNNAAKFGITVIYLTKSADGGSKGKDRESKYLAHAKDSIRLISDSKGRLYIEDNVRWVPFKWIEAPTDFPTDFIPKIAEDMKPSQLGMRLFDRYKPSTPKKTKAGKRKSIELPFAVDDEDRPVICSFENETFAAYVMGAAGSGKSTLLHSLICGILMNYHPDEVELWLMDFKMLEFKRYVDNRPPHVKYLLLEKSEDLVFDILDRLTEELERREYVFAQRGWQKLGDVPVEEYMPAVFVIIDEFAQMSQILKETKGSGYGSDYTIKLENLLARGRALGFKFIFASQSFEDGVTGLTDNARKQIQLRFALKNTPSEIKSTLVLTSDQITPELSRDISSLPAYETLFKWRDEAGDVRVGRFRNMYAESGEIDALVTRITEKMRPVNLGTQTDDDSYIEKNPVLVDGAKPKTFQSQIPVYKKYERTLDEDSLDEEDILIYPGVPCSFNLARPFTLFPGTAENILVAGGDRDSSVNVIQSVIACFTRTKKPIEIWAHGRSPIMKKYRHTVFSKHEQVVDLSDVCNRVKTLKKSISKRVVEDRLIICFGLESIFNDLEIMGDEEESYNPQPIKKPRQSSLPDMSEVLERVKACDDPEEKKRIIAEYNAQRDAMEDERGEQGDAEAEQHIYDAREDIKWLFKRGSNFGIHFLICFSKAQDFIDLKIDGHLFRHKLLFPMSRDESLSLVSSRKANEIDGGTFLYSDSKTSYTMRPHIYRGIPCNGWVLESSGHIIQKGGML